MHVEDTALIRRRMGEEWFETFVQTVTLTIKVVAPERLDDGPAKVIRFLADQLRSTAH